MKISFCGAAGGVTGSCYLIESGKEKVLVDCGMFQGLPELSARNYDDFPFYPGNISFVFLTHAHIDHSGRIPKLVKEGFRGDIITTDATRDLCRIMLLDSANVAKDEARRENDRRELLGKPPVKPLYGTKDAKEALKLFSSAEYGKPCEMCEEITAVFRDAGHILGSASVELGVNEDGKKKRIVFSGDLGQRETPIIKDPETIAKTDYLVIESTYGGRLHENRKEREELFLKHALDAYKKKGKLIIPSFAVERTQELLYSIRKLRHEGSFPHMEVFLDSPLATKATEVFKKHREVYDKEAEKYGDPFATGQIKISSSVKDSIRLNDYDKACIIIAGSGMCTGGRIVHHLYHGLEDKKNTVLFVGYQAEGTRGRDIISGARFVNLLGDDVRVNAKIAKIDGYSAHADQNELIWWANSFNEAPKKTFITHGEKKSSLALKKKLQNIGHDCIVPQMGQKKEL